MADVNVALVVFDWAGTTVDHGCFAPLAAFDSALRQFGVTLSATQIRQPMGLHKRDHIRQLMQLPEASEQWRSRHDREWTDEDIDTIFSQHFVPNQLQAISGHAELIPEVVPCLEQLRQRDIKIGATTGYFLEAARRVYAIAAEQGYRPDCCICAEEVRQARPAPWMMFRIMEQLEVYPPAAVVKVGDTPADMAEGRNAGSWSVGVVHSSSDVACTREELEQLEPAARDERLQAARERLWQGGAHYLIDTLSELPAVLNTIDDRLAAGTSP